MLGARFQALVRSVLNSVSIRMTARLLTLGRLALEIDGEIARGPVAQRRRLALLALLASAREAGLSREKIVGLLWAEHSPANARRILSEAIYVVRRAVGEVIVAGGLDDLQLDSALLRSDVAEFRYARAQGRLDEAAELYVGDFLEGFRLDDAAPFERWADGERSRLRSEFAAILEKIAEQASSAGRLDEAVHRWQRLAAHDPYNARFAMGLMEAMTAAGEPTSAIRHAAVHATLMREELELPSDSAVEALAERIKADLGTRPQPLRAARAAPQSGDEIDRVSSIQGLQILRALGQGRSAEVLLARDTTLGRLVAVKRLRPELVQDPTARSRFEREMRTIARIDHPNVAAIYQVGQLPDGSPYFVLPYIESGTLEDRLHAIGRLDATDTRVVLRQLASALAAAHRKGVIHRDVRPANILYDPTEPRALLTDFGIAGLRETFDLEAVRLTKPHERLGLPAYASPEQIQGHPVDDRTDVYSLGVTGYQMLAGRLPFEDSDPAALAIAHVESEPPPLAAVAPDAPAELNTLVSRCLNKKPLHRPSAADIARVLS
jgi:DNA-binding SARP family transcriptional activator/tRNA A-37 threonylcarbamoyl transferase component Bud32